MSIIAEVCIKKWIGVIYLIDMMHFRISAPAEGGITAIRRYSSIQ